MLNFGVRLTASREQQQGIVQINGTVNSLDHQTQQNASVASQTQDISLVTSRLAKELVENADNKQFIGKENIKVN